MTPQAEADIIYPAAHTVELHLRPLADTAPDSHHSDYGFRVYYGILPPGGATLEAAAGPRRDLLKSPTSGDEFPHSHFTRRTRERMDFNLPLPERTSVFSGSPMGAAKGTP